LIFESLDQVGVAGFEPTASSSRTTPPASLRTMGALERFMLHVNPLVPLARYDYERRYSGLAAD
jgi:hypothetical protein